MTPEQLRALENITPESQKPPRPKPKPHSALVINNRIVPRVLESDDIAREFYLERIDEIDPQCHQAWIVHCQLFSDLMRAERGSKQYYQALTPFMASSKSFLLTPHTRRSKQYKTGLEKYSADNKEDELEF